MYSELKKELFTSSFLDQVVWVASGLLTKGLVS